MIPMASNRRAGFLAHNDQPPEGRLMAMRRNTDDDPFTLLDTPSAELAPGENPAENELRHEAWKVWAAYAHLSNQQSALPLCILLRTWIDRHGLTREEATAVMRDMLAPERVAKGTYAADYITGLAKQVLRQQARKRKLEVYLEQKAKAKADRAGALTPEQTRKKLLNGIGDMPQKGKA